MDFYKRFGGFISYTFAAEQPWGLGVEARLGVREERPPELWGCVHQDERGSPFFFGGGALRLSWFPRDHAQMMLAAQGGRAFASVLSGLGELGVGYRWGKDAGFDPLIGAELGLSYASLGLHLDPSRVELSPFMGAYSEPLVVTDPTQCVVVPGRPLRRRDGAMMLPQLVRAGTATRLRGREVVAAARVWERRAQTELASVPAFVRLVAELRALSAPASLVRRCREAAADELRHAWMAANLSANLSGQTVSLDYGPVSLTDSPRQTPEIVRMALDNWEDGCVGESAAAHCAAVESRLARHRSTRDMLRTVAREESRHAALAWDVLAFLTTVGGGEVREVLLATAQAVSLSADDPSAPPADLEAFGILGAETEREIMRRRRHASIARLRAVLAA